MTNKRQQLINQLSNKKILILGAGLTGLSCVRFLQSINVACAVNDSRTVVSGLIESEYNDVRFELGAWNTQLLNEAEIVLASPGIDLIKEGLLPHLKPSCKVLGDIELFCLLNEKPVIAVTGSNGKSTVVSLLAHIGQKLGINIALAGNIGTPILSQLQDEIDCYVLELSSFQLETTHHMCSVAATVLNISDDHLDRHQTIENYAQIKQKIFENCINPVINRDDLLAIGNMPEQSLSYGVDRPAVGDFGLVQTEGQTFLTFGDELLINVELLPLAGQHNHINYLSALALGYKAGWPVKEMIGHLSSFTGLAHRCQRIVSNDDVQWINDSKATNIGATLAAIKGISANLSNKQQLILIAGGDGKGADFTQLEPAVTEHVAHMFLLGKDAHEIAKISTKHTIVESMQDAVIQASKLAAKNDIVLLSPACASIDMFTNYMVRGDKFIAAVNDLAEVNI